MCVRACISRFYAKDISNFFWVIKFSHQAKIPMIGI